MRVGKDSWTPLLVVCLVIIPVVNSISFPFFGSFSRQPTPPPTSYAEHKDARIINADHGGSSGNIGPAASLAGGSFGHSPWISGTRDQFIRDQLVILHPDSPLNREAWKDSGYLNADSEFHRENGGVTESMVPSARTPPARVRKPARKSKEQTAPAKSVVSVGDTPTQNVDNSVNASPTSPQLVPSSGGLYEMLPPPMPLFRDFSNQNADTTSVDNDEPSLIHEPILLPANNFFLPYTAPIFPYSPRAIASHSTLPPEAMIQFLKSPEQEISPMTRPQVKLPFPLSHDCSANTGGGKPLQFVVLPIVEPVAPLKPIFPKPSFLSSQNGLFPYIPPFNLFNKKPLGLPNNNFDGSSNSNGIGQSGPGSSSGQFVPILNRPAPPLPFVFVQSLPLELIGQNMEMDVLNSSPSQTSETKINDVSPIAAPPPPPSSVPTLQSPSAPVAPPPVTSESITSSTRPLPLIVIEKVKTPGQPPSSPVAPAAAVVEISKQSIPKNGGSGGSSPLSTISVIKPITAPGSEPHTLEQQKEIHKAIEKLVPVAAAVLENVEQQKQQKEGKDQAPAAVSPSSAPLVTSTETPISTSTTVTSSTSMEVKKLEKETSLRPPLRPAESNQESVVGTTRIPTRNDPLSSASEEIVGLGVNPTAMSDVIITEA